MKKFNDRLKLEDYLRYLFLNVIFFLFFSALFSFFKLDFTINQPLNYILLAITLFSIDTFLLFGLLQATKYLFRKRACTDNFESSISLIIYGIVFIISVLIFIQILAINAIFDDCFSYDSNNYMNACIIIGAGKLIEVVLYQVIKRLKGEKI